MDLCPKVLYITYPHKIIMKEAPRKNLYHLILFMLLIMILSLNTFCLAIENKRNSSKYLYCLKNIDSDILCYDI